MKSTKVLAIAIGMTLMVFSAKQAAAQWYVGGSLGYTTENTVSLLHFSPEAGYSFHPRWTVGISTSLINVSKDVTTAESQTERKSVFYWYLNPYVRFNFFQMDRLSLFADATGNFDANHGFDVIYIGLRPGISYQLTDCFTAVAHIGFIGSYNHELRAEVGLNNLEFSLYYLFGKKK